MKITKVINNKTFLVLFSLGLLCLFTAGLSLFISLNPHLFKNQIQYEVGSVVETKGKVQLKTSSGKLEDVVKKQPVYSRESFVIEQGASLKLKLSEENIEIFGPANFNIHVVSPEKAHVFVNFSKFSSVEPKTKLEKIKLTFDGWLIEPYFKPSERDTTKSQELSFPAISKDEPTENNGVNNESMLAEVIGSKRELLKRCYENYLRKNPLATGKLVVEFTLNPTGKVSSSRIKDSSFFKDESFKNCIQDVFTRIKTKPFDGESILVVYPIEFE